MRSEESTVDSADNAGTAPKGKTQGVVNHVVSTGIIQDKDNFIADQNPARPAACGTAAKPTAKTLG